ncbi:MAG: acyl carrier protein [Alphaproteobacteria bacterium]
MANNDDRVLDQISALLERYNANDIEITSSTSLDSELNIDSVAAMDLIMEIEDEFEIDIPINHLPDIETLQDLVDLVHQRIEGR